MAKDPRESPFVIDPKSGISAPAFTWPDSGRPRGGSMIADMARRAGLNSGAVNIGDQINGRSFNRIWMDELSTHPFEEHRSQFEHDYLTSPSTAAAGTARSRDQGGSVDMERAMRILAVDEKKDKREAFMRMLVDIDEGREQEEVPRPAGVETQDEETGSW